MPPGVLVVSRLYPSYDLPGRGSFVADQVAALVAAGASPVVASFETVQLRGSRETLDVAERAWSRSVTAALALTTGGRWGAAGVPVARLPVVRTWGTTEDPDVPELVARHTAILLPFARSLAARSVADGRPLDVIHAHNGLPDGLAAAAVAEALGLPLVVTEHDSTLPRRLEEPATRSAYRRLVATGRVVAVSRALARRIEAELTADGEPPLGIEVVPNPIPVDRFPLAGGEGRDPNELLWVGSRGAHKGIETLLRATALARARRPGLRLRAIGPASVDEDARWSALARDLGIDASVVFESATDRAGVARAMQRAAVFVHPSPWETFGVVAAEALASGLPVAATPSGGVEGILDSDERLGQVAAGHRPDDLATAILAVHDRFASVDRAALRAAVTTRFSPEVVAARTLELYAESSRGRSPVVERPGAAASAAAGSAAWPDAVGSGATRGPIRAALVVARHRSTMARVAALPPDEGIITQVVGPTGREATSAVPTRSTSTLVARAVRRIGRRFSAPPAAPDPEARWIAAVVEGWRAALVVAGDAGPVIVAADADDVALAGLALGETATTHLSPGSLRWLADGQDASGAAMSG